ncbi:MAG: hypothetical protein HQ580_16160 [Planctomycetes bacterium]|nr:hypothetical protein [Planctomycetota bacterium]
MEVLTGVKTIDDYTKMEEKFKEYLIKEFGIDRDFSKYPLVEIRVSNLDKAYVLSPTFGVRQGDLFDMVAEYVDEVTFSVHAKIRLRK